MNNKFKRFEKSTASETEPKRGIRQIYMNLTVIKQRTIYILYIYINFIYIYREREKMFILVYEQ